MSTEPTSLISGLPGRAVDEPVRQARWSVPLSLAASPRAGVVVGLGGEAESSRAGSCWSVGGARVVRGGSASARRDEAVGRAVAAQDRRLVELCVVVLAVAATIVVAD
jgi:hypothetical protein